jgi:hypothetical protein
MVRIDPVTGNVGIGTPEAQPAAQEGRDWSLLEATQESLREHMAEIKRLKAAQPAPVQEPVAQSLKDAVFTVIEGFNIPPDVRKILESAYYNAPPAAQPAVQMGRDWSLLAATQESLREHMAEIKRLKAQPVPVKTYSGGKPWPVAPKPWVGLSEEEVYEAAHYCVKSGQSVNETIRAIEAKLKEKNHDQ